MYKTVQFGKDDGCKLHAWLGHPVHCYVQGDWQECLQSPPPNKNSRMYWACDFAAWSSWHSRSMPGPGSILKNHHRCTRGIVKRSIEVSVFPRCLWLLSAMAPSCDLQCARRPDWRSFIGKVGPHLIAHIALSANKNTCFFRWKIPEFSDL